MKYRHATLEPALALSAAGTKTIDLDMSEPISRIDIRFEITKSQEGMNAHPAKDITTIEIVDGSDVIHSLNGYQNQGLAIYSRRVPTMVHGQHSQSNQECSLYGIDFGRFLWDPMLAFVPTMFKNPQLKITYVLTNCDDGASAGELEVFAHLFDEKTISPIGFLMAKEAHSYTCGAENSYETVKLPRDFPIRQMLIRAFHDGHEVWDSIKEVRLDENNLKRTLWDINVEDYHRMKKGVDPVVEELIQGITNATGKNYYITPSDYWQVVCALSESGDVNMYTDGVQPGGKFKLYAASNAQFRGIARGYLPNHCLQFLMGDLKDIEDWFDPRQLESLRLRMRAGTSGASGIGEVVLEQLRYY